MSYIKIKDCLPLLKVKKKIVKGCVSLWKNSEN